MCPQYREVTSPQGVLGHGCAALNVVFGSCNLVLTLSKVAAAFRCGQLFVGLLLTFRTVCPNLFAPACFSSNVDVECYSFSAGPNGLSTGSLGFGDVAAHSKSKSK